MGHFGASPSSFQVVHFGCQQRETCQCWYVLECFNRNVTHDDSHLYPGALPVLVKLLSEGHERTKIFALRCLWSLSFHPNNKFQMQCEPDLINQLNSKVSAVNPLIRKHAQGILWVLHFGHSNSSGGASSGALMATGMNISGSGEHVEDSNLPPLSMSPSAGGQNMAFDANPGDVGTHVFISVEEYENAAVKRIKVRNFSLNVSFVIVLF